MHTIRSLKQTVRALRQRIADLESQIAQQPHWLQVDIIAGEPVHGTGAREILESAIRGKNRVEVTVVFNDHGRSSNRTFRLYSATVEDVIQSGLTAPPRAAKTRAQNS